MFSTITRRVSARDGERWVASHCASGGPSSTTDSESESESSDTGTSDDGDASDRKRGSTNVHALSPVERTATAAHASLRT